MRDMREYRGNIACNDCAEHLKRAAPKVMQGGRFRD